MNRSDHLSNEILLLSIDGELPSQKALIVKLHLDSCWSCRVQKERIERTITRVIEERDSALEPYLPPPALGNAAFLTRLEGIAAEESIPPVWQRFPLSARNWLHQRNTGVWGSGLILAGMVAVVLLVALLPQQLRVVSANELLEKAEFSESIPTLPQGRAVVRQKIQIQVGGATFVKTSYHDLTSNRRAEQWNGKDSNVALAPASVMSSAAGNAFEALGFDWSTPLSPARYRSWRDHLPDKIESVTASDGLLTLKTQTQTSFLQEAELSVRAKDFHPLIGRFRFKDHYEFTITELSYDVLDKSSLSSSIFEPKMEATREEKARPASPLEIAPVRPLAPSPAELAAAELQARIVLHSLGGDLGEDINLTRSAAGRIEATGIVASTARKQELIDGLSGIPHVTAKIAATEEVASEQVIAAQQVPLADAPVKNQPRLARELEKQFPYPEDRSAYVNQVLDRSGEALSRAWALRKLAERYSPEEIALLNPDGREEFHTLLEEDLTELERTIKTEREVLSVFVSPVSNEIPVPNSQNWRIETASLFAEVALIHQHTMVLFAGADPEGLSNDALLQELRVKLNASQIAIAGLREKITREFASASPVVK